MFQYKRFLFYLFSIIFLTSVFSSQAKAESITDYSILATEKIHLKHRAKIKSGFVGVNDENLHESFELRLGRHVVTEPAVRLTAPRVILQKKAKVKGDVYYRDDLVLRHGAVILGQQVVRNGADDWPLFDIPVSPTCSPDGNNDVLVAKNQSDTLAAGVYGDITVKRRGTLVLSGGDYQMRTLHIGKNAKVIVSDDATLCVENHLMTRARAFLGADPDDSNVTAGDVKVYVNGEDQYHCPYDHSDDENDHHHNASAVKFGKRSVVFAQVKALNGTIKIRKAVQAHGAYIGKKVFVGKRSVITHEVNGNQPDVTAPQILGVNPVDGSTVGTADPIILAQFSDDDSGVDVGSVVILLDNVDVTTQANVTVSGFSFTASSLNNGAHSLSIQLSDLAGNATGSDTTFTVDVDVTPPEITQIIPVQGSVLNSATVSMSAMFSDLDSLIDVSSVVIRIDEFDITNDVILSETGFSITLDAPLADGTHSLFIHVEDTSGNATEVTTIFTVDTEAPLINVLIPTDGSLLANDLPQIQGNWSDVTSGVDSSTAQIILNGEDLTSSASITESGFDVTVTTPLSDGTHTLNISITDVAGNVGTGLITFTTDTSPPVFSNVVPVNGSTVTTNVPVISGDLSDNVSGIDTDSFQILIDGVDVTLADTATETNFSFTPSTPLSNGNHTVLLRVEDIAGNLTEITFSFNVLVDFVPPTISNIQPLNGSTLNTDTPTISATFSDDMSGINIANTQILLDNVDVTTQANATETGFSFVATSLSDGSHTLSISITDGNGNPAATNVTFSIDTTPPNQPPVLNVIGDQSVDLGTSLNFTVSGSDPNNDPLSFSVSPLPLPENSSFNSQTGFFNFVPQADQVGVISLTFKVSDGEFFDEEVVVITVEEPVVGAPTSISGRVLDTNSFVATGVEVPVVGAVVSLLNTGFSVVTDASGQFILSGVSAGHQILDINPSSANAAPDGSSYAGFREAINLMASVENIIERPLYLPRIATESLTPVDPNTTTIVTNPTLGISIEVPPNTAKNEDGSDFTGSLSISEVPEGLAPAAMPENLQPGLLITIQPVGVIFSTPVAITFPNIDNLPSGSRLDLWSLDPNGGVFVIVGTGEVSVDGSVIETTFGGIRRADWHSFLPPIVSLVGRVGNPTIQISSLCAKSCTGSETSLSSGSLSEKHSLASYRFFGQQQVLQFHYDSLRADPRPILKVNNRLGSIASPITISSQLKIAGIDQNIEIFTDVTALTLNDEIHQAIQFDGSSFNTGLYRYELISKNNYLFSSLSNSFTGRVVVNNQKDSPFGSGWTLGGLSHLKSTSGGHLLVDGDGSFFLFTKEVNLSAPMSNFAGGLPNTVAKGDFNEDGYLDLITVNQAADNISLLLGDGTGNFGFPSNFAVGITDPIQVTINDFNNDAHLDVALPGSPNNVISILFGDGTGGFAPLVQIPSPGGSGAIVSGDLNNDGAEDIVVGHGGSISVFLGDGAGNFSSPTNLSTGTVGSFMLLEDFNNDNRLDFVTSTLGSTDSISILLGDGSGGFFPRLNFTVGITPQGLTSGDFNGDGKRDLAVANLNSRSVSVLLGTGTGSFLTAVNFPSGFRPFDVVSEDFNGDNILDLAVTNSGDNTLSILLGDGTGEFGSPVNFSTQSIPRGIVAGQFSSDSQMDIAVANRAASAVSVYLGEPTNINRFQSPSGDFSTLIKNIDGTFTRTLKEGTQINFNAQGLQTSVVDRNNNIITYAYDINNHLTTITDPKGLTTSLSYSNGLLDSIIDPVGRTTVFIHDVNNDLVQIIDPDNTNRQFNYDANHRMISQTSKNNFVTTYTYNFAGRNIQADRPDGSIRKVTPSEIVGLIDIASGVGTQANPAPVVLPADVKASFTDGNNGTTDYITDSFGATTQTTDALNRTIVIDRDENASPTQITDPNGAITVMTYDNQGNLLTIQNQSINATNTFSYEPLFNQIATITDPKGNTTTINYDSNGNPIEIIDAQTIKTALEYTDTNCPGQLTKITNAQGLPEENTTQFQYDPLTCNLLKTIDFLSQETTLNYDSAGNVINTTDAEGNITQFSYDLHNRLTQVTDAANETSNYIYDAAGNLIQVNDAKGNTTDFEYDSQNRLIKTSDPLGNFETYQYDPNNNLIQSTDRNNQTINFTYDVVNQLIQKTLPGNLNTTYTYDLLSNLTSVNDPDSNLNFTYDGASRLTSTATTGSANQPDVTINYTYDKNHNRTNLTDSLGGTSDYVYDTLNRLTSISKGTDVFSFNYDNLNRRTSTNLPNGTMTSYTYDAANQLTNLTHNLGATSLANFTYTYDQVGNRTSMTTTRSGVSVNSPLNYIYDNLYRLTNATNPLPTMPDETFTYDSLGNRLQKQGQSTDASFTPSNRLMEDEAFTYIYDLNGNMVQKTNKTTSDVTDYIYDAEDQLIEIKENNVTIATYKYDGLGRRIEKIANGITKRYIYDNEDILLEFDGANILQARYTHGAGIDEPLMMERDLDLSGTFDAIEQFQYHVDGLGSITDLTDSTGAVVQSYVYDSFGEIVTQVGTLENPYTYTGREIDAESGLYYYRARYYDPEVGRFLQEDPIGFADSLNLYIYVQNNPVNYIDPYGEFAQVIAVGGLSNPVGWVIVGVGVVGYVGYKAYQEYQANRGNTCPIQYQSDSPSEDDLSDREGDIGEKTGLTAEEVKKKIHKAKNKGLPRSGPIKNPDVAVDTNTGEIYPKIPGGGYGDSIGNIFD